MVKHLPANADGFDPWVRKIPWSRKWQPNPIVLPGESHGQRSLAGYSSQGCKELDMIERLSARAHTHTHDHDLEAVYKELHA